jgi:ADP-heptose:LPS heptosyltransferase
MKPLLERLPAGGRVAVVRLRSMGDCVLTTPALQILKTARPDLEVAVVVEPRFAAVFEGNPAVGKLLTPAVSSIAQWRPDLAINLHGGSRSIVLTLASRAKYRAGFGHYRATWAYNILIPRAQQILGVDRGVHTAEHLASAMFYLGAPHEDIPRATLFAAPWPRLRPYAVIHPFASSPAKTWPADRFAATARHLRDQGGLDPLIVCGPGDDPAPFADFETLYNAPLSQVKSVIRSASLFIGNDSGPAHIAAAFDVPVVVLFGGSDSAVWRPWKPSAAETLVRARIEDIAVTDVAHALSELRRDSSQRLLPAMMESPS